MATKPAETAAAAAPPKSKKMLVLVLVGVLIIASAGIGAFVYVSKQRAAAQFGDEEEPAARQVQQPSGPPTYLPLDSMVVNLADPGGERVAQIGVTFELMDAAASDKVKQYLPTIRSGVLMLMSQRTSVELLQREGKEKLARDILREASRPFGGVDEEEADEVNAAGATGEKKSSRKRARPPGEQPVRRVLFSSFIVQ